MRLDYGAQSVDLCSLNSSVKAASWCGRARDLQTLHDPAPFLDLDALQVALTRLDHSPQKGKASVGRSGALSNRRPPSRGSRSSRRSSADSLHLIQDQQYLEEDLVIPRVVNIEVQLEGDKGCKPVEQKIKVKHTKDLIEGKFTFREQLQEPISCKHKTEENWKHKESFNANQEIRRKLYETRHRRSIGGSNPLLNFTSEAEESFKRIKEEVAQLAAKRRSSSDISESWPPSNVHSTVSAPEYQRSEVLKKWNEERESLLESASAILEKEGEEHRSSSEADVVISDRESIADSGLVNRRTVIKINEKKSKSATNLIAENSTPLWIRDLETRRSLRGRKEESNSRVIPIHIDSEFEGGINVSIVNQSESPRRDSTSRMYVRQCDSENRPSRASAFNVRRTIEKRQVQQERRERKVLREQIREQLRSLSEGRERRDSSGSYGSSSQLSQNSVRSKSMSSLDQDQDDFRSESPLFKVQSSPTLEKEKEGIRSYLFGASNLTESGSSSHISPAYREEIQVVKQNNSEPSNSYHTAQVTQNTQDFEQPNTRQWTKSWDSLKTEKQENCESKSKIVSKSVDSVQVSNQNIQLSTHQASVLSHTPQKQRRKKHSLSHTEQETHLLNQDTDVIDDYKSTDSSIKFLPQDTASINTDSITSLKEEYPPENRPIPPPRKHRLSLSTGHITLEGEEKPNWIRLAKERRSLRAAKPVDQLSDRASTASKEPEWVARARKKLEALNVTLTSTTDFNSVSSHITESSSAWSRGGLDALDDLREETSRIGDELAEEASARVNEDLGLKKESNKMLEHNTDRSRDPSTERPRVSFEPSAVETSDGDPSRKYRCRKPLRDEVRFGDLKHDWGGVQTKTSKTSTGKQKEMRFGEIQTKETVAETPPERTKETWFGDHMKNPPTPKTQSNPSSPNGSLPVMRFGDTPLNLFPVTQPKGVQSSSKFESVAGPDPTKMTAEQLNQNVEEYDFPIPTGKEDATELMKFLEESLKKIEVVPEVVVAEDHKPKPKSILKRRSVENVLHELKIEEKSELLQKVEHRKSASFDWDTVGKGGDASLDIGHTRNNGLKAGTEHYNQHLEGSNRMKKLPQHNPSTSTSIATNSSFFNVKLRHVSSNKREPAITNESPSRFHTEHALHRRSLVSNSNIDRHNENFSSINTYTNSHEIEIGSHKASNGADSHGSSPSASSQESLSDTGGGLSQPETDHDANEIIVKENNHLEEYKKVVRKISKRELPFNYVESDSHVTRWNNDIKDGATGDKGPPDPVITTLPPPRKGVTMGSKTVRELLQKVQEPPSPAWGTCRSGRGLNATALVRTSLLTRLTNRPSPAWLH